jgi:transposase
LRERRISNVVTSSSRSFRPAPNSGLNPAAFPAPHFTTIAAFISKLKHEIVSLFGDVLLYASELGLIGKEHFAIDGCKLPSNASKKWRGTHKELEEKRKKLERVAERMGLR